MDLKLIEKTPTSIEIEFHGEGDSLLHPMKELLLKEEDVVTATVLKTHPVLGVPRLYVEVSAGKPEQHVKNAAKALRKAYDDFETAFLQATGA